MIRELIFIEVLLLNLLSTQIVKEFRGQLRNHKVLLQATPLFHSALLHYWQQLLYPLTSQVMLVRVF